ncbi:MAG: nitroreductase [Lachnospiraceae bacterium]|nr:nitroreductase [Lachnospiraceae bacterium]
MQVLLNRKSTKNFKPDPVPEYIIDKIIEAGLWAPSGMNRQAGIIVAITDKALIERLSKMNADIMGAKMDPFYNAPCVLLVLAKKEVRTYVYDGSLVMGNMMTAAEALGVGSCWIHRAKEEFESEEGKQILKEIGIEGNYEGIGHCVVGFPASLPESKQRIEGRVFKVK